MNDTDQTRLSKVMQFAGNWLTVTALAKRMSVHPDTIRRWASSGKIKYVRHPINNYRLFLIDDLESEILNLDEK